MIARSTRQAARARARRGPERLRRFHVYRFGHGSEAVLGVLATSRAGAEVQAGRELGCALACLLAYEIISARRIVDGVELVTYTEG